MKVGVLFSGGKDSCLALSKAMEKDEVACLITIFSKNPESYMFHTPNIELTRIQSEAINLPLVQVITNGVKEEELKDLEDAINEAKIRYGIEGVVTGAIESVYQGGRIQEVCEHLDLWCFNPLWKKDQEQLLREILKKGFSVIISGVFAYPFDEKWLGREIDEKTIEELVKLKNTYKISPSGEGGEIETTVLDAPFFSKRIKILDFETRIKGNSGVFLIKKTDLVSK